MNLSEALRTAILLNDDVTRYLGEYTDLPAVIIRKRLPADVAEPFPSPMVLISEDTGEINQDLINTNMSIFMRQLSVYGAQNRDTANVDLAAAALRTMFHRKKRAITIPDFQVSSIVVDFVRVAPDDGPVTVGRVLGLSIRIRETAFRTA